MSALPQINNAAARRLFLQAHALTEPPTGACSRKGLAQLINRLGFVQVDSINTVARAHHMILWSRKTAYRPDDLKALLEQDRALWEHWTHDASILPVQVYPYWQQRFERDAERLRGNWARWFRDGYEDQFERILTRIQADGPVTSSDVGQGEARGKGGWWDWHPSKTALEWLWRTGQLAIGEAVGQWAQAALMPSAHVLSDGLGCFTAVTSAGCLHTPIVVGQRKPRDLPEFTWVNTVLGNLKTTLSGAFHAFKYPKYASSYLAAFAYRFNRRFDLRGPSLGLSGSFGGMLRIVANQETSS